MPERSRLALIPGAFFAIAPLLVVLTADGEPFDLVWPLCAVLLAEAAWGVWTFRERAGGLFHPYLLFFVSTLLFNGGQALLEVFGLNPDGILGNAYPPSALVHTLAFVISSLGALHVGALLALRTPMAPRTPPSPAESEALQKAGLWITAVAIGPLLIRVGAAIQTVLARGYMGLYQPAEAVGLESALVILEELIVPGSLLLIAAGRSRLWSGWLPGGVLVAYAVSQLFLGYRANAVFPLIAALWLRSRVATPIRLLPVAAIAALLLVVVFPVIAKTRTVAGEERASISFLEEAFEGIERPFLAVFTEMGGSMLTVTETQILVPSSHAYELGEGYAYALLTVVPSLFWARHPTIARGTPGVWLTEQIDPVQAMLGGSVGFSAVAETFLNFGWAGPLVMLLFGFGLVRFTAWADRKGAVSAVAVAAFLPSMLFFARSDSSTTVRPILWYGLAPYLLIQAVLRHSRKSSLRTVPA